MKDTKNLKTGILTTEFWVTLAASGTGVAVMLGYLQPTDADQLIEAITQIVGGLITLVTTVSYIRGRVMLKRDSMSIGSGIDGLLKDSGASVSSKPSAIYPK